MIGVLIQLLIVLLVLCVVFYIVRLAAGQFGIPDIFITIVGLILGLIFILYVVNAFGLMGPSWRIH